MDLKVVTIKNPQGLNFILGQSHFIKTVEDIHEAVVQTVPGIKFGLAFCEASGPRLVRCSGNDAVLIELAKMNALALGAGHSFILFMENAFPINLLRTVSNVPEVCGIFCATANQVDVIIAETELGRGIMGIIDGQSPLGVETEDDVKNRTNFLRTIGYKLG